jgi:hypothetical protein
VKGTAPTGSAVTSTADNATSVVDGVTRYAAGTSYVPADMLAFIHKGEMVIPAADADRIRKNVVPNGGGRSGDSYTWVMPEPPTRDPFEVLERTSRYARWGRLSPEPAGG